MKRTRLREGGLEDAAIESRFNITQRIDAEERSLDNAAFVVTSTRQEIREQYEIYDNYRPERMIVMPPGVDLARFTPVKRSRRFETHVKGLVAPFLRDPDKPMILAISRPDRRKNIGALIRAFGENSKLRDKANLVILAGSRDDISKMPFEAREVYDEILRLVDLYGLYGIAAYPKRHVSDDVPDIYRLAAKTGGVFVNPALTEPFGLTLIEAAACGLPVVATHDGGPVDIISACKNGLLVNPTDPAAIGDALEQVVSDKSRWRKWSRSGIAGVGRTYSWPGHVKRYVEAVEKVVNGSGILGRAWPRRGRRHILQDRILICDIDNTLIGDRQGLVRLMRLVKANSHRLLFGVATGRSLALTLDALKEWNIPVPDTMIVAVGSEMYHGAHMFEDKGWARHISYRWKPEIIRSVLAEIPWLSLQPAEGQGKRKISYFVEPGRVPKLREISGRLRRAGVSASLIYSHESFLDVLPVRASKGSAVRYFANKWDIPFERMMVAGDSGNDEEMLIGDTLGVVVGNHSPELDKLRGRERIYFANGRCAWGVVEALEHYKFFD